MRDSRLTKWVEKVKKLIEEKNLTNDGNRRGAEFELAGIASIRPDYFFVAEPDYCFQQSAPKDIDVGIPKIDFGIEMFSPKRNAVPLTDISNCTENEA